MKPSRPLVRQDQLLRTLRSPTSKHLRPSISPQCPRFQQQARTFLRRAPTSHRAVENLNLNRMRSDSYDYHVRRRNFLMAGAIAGAVAFVYTAYLLQKEINKPVQCDAGLPAGSVDPFSTEAGSKRKTIVHDADGREIVPTGHSSITSFPRHLELDLHNSSSDERSPQHPTKIHTGGVDYTLVGLGMRTVSFLGIQVYLVGYYVATADVAALQKQLMREIHPTATTLVPSEKDELRRRLLDPAEGDKIWADLLREVKPRSLFRIVPVRDTDFHHLRDGFVRAITARAALGGDEYREDSFGEAMRDFRNLFNRGKVPKAGELIMARDDRGCLTVVFDDGKNKDQKQQRITLGRVEDERVSRALWMNYLAGKAVASEPARKNIVDGILEFVERPVGTVAAQVV
ncbi:Chalcone isomerase- subgroup [Apiospora kogelbergensis]|uniref:Chalcone isomerase- subgroup n=1 Tax=Apiospora kogelbergensis TaxID=1337665 RepID=A0AAW0R540_9PEZI